MDFFFVVLISFFASGLTLLTGFGLGTLLFPVLALFFSLPEALAMTAVVHLANNVFKLLMFVRQVQWPIVWNFGAPAVVGAFLGAIVMFWLGDIPPLWQYRWGNKICTINSLKLAMAVLMAFFAFFEIWPPFKKLTFDRKFLSWGGALSGFLGGLSGHQGALRSAFLVRSGLTKEAFIATGVVLACLVDLARITVYARHWEGLSAENWGMTWGVVVASLLGVLAGQKYLKKVTIDTIQKLVAGLIILIALGLAVGCI